MNPKRQYISASVTQIIALVLYIMGIFVMMGYDAIILNPIPYFLGSAVLILIIDTLILMRIFKDKNLEVSKTNTTTIL